MHHWAQLPATHAKEMEDNGEIWQEQDINTNMKQQQLTWQNAMLTSDKFNEGVSTNLGGNLIASGFPQDKFTHCVWT